MNPDKYRDVDFKPSFILKSNYKHKKGKEAKPWETQYKNIWSGKKR